MPTPQIRHLHCRIDGIAEVDGSCAECDHRWPCPSYHLAAGFGLDAFYECEKHRWYSHLGVPLR